MRKRFEVGRPGDYQARRRLLTIGGLGLLGSCIRRAPAAQSTLPRPLLPLRSCILLFYYGGPSQVDIWDMKPLAPAEVRGEFRPIRTAAPEIQICDHLPRTARVAQHLCLIRSMHHSMTNHNSAAVEALCGRAPTRGDLELLGDDALAFPCYGAMVNFLQKKPGALPSVALPHVMYNVVKLPGQSAGLLGTANNPLQIEADPSAPDFSVPVLNVTDAMPVERLQDRRSLADSLDSLNSAVNAKGGMFRDRAFQLLNSPSLRSGLDLAAENPRARDRYGRNKLGQSLLLARRLVEAGVRFITVHDGVANGQDINWDSHQSVFPRMRDHLLPPADQGYSALIEDLAARGLLDETLVIAMGEFGRGPKLNGGAGRDHWPHCYSIVLAGGGIRGGTVHGRSDKIGAYPDADGVTPADLSATVLWRLGLDHATTITDATGRPIRLSEGEPLTSLFAGA